MPSARDPDLVSLQYQPDPALRAYVDKITLHEDRRQAASPLLVFPRPYLVLGFQYGERMKVSRAGSEQTLAASGVTGLQSAVRHAHSSRDNKFVLVHLKSWAAAAFLPGPMYAFLDRHVDLSDLFPAAQMTETQQRLREGKTDRERVDTVQALLSRRLDAGAVDPLLKAAVEKLQAGNGSLQVRELAEALSVGGRRLERCFSAGIGTSPKQFTLLLRVAFSLQFHQRGLTLSEIAGACGFFDQAHFTHAFERFTDLSPGSYFSLQRAAALS